jgi:hypothetical protein
MNLSLSLFLLICFDTVVVLFSFLSFPFLLWLIVCHTLCHVFILLVVATDSCFFVFDVVLSLMLFRRCCFNVVYSTFRRCRFVIVV